MTEQEFYKGVEIHPYEFAAANDLGGGEYEIIKCFTQWRHVGGVDDLRRGREYIRRVLANSGSLTAWRGQGRRITPLMTAHQYCDVNCIQGIESEIIRAIYFWQHNLNAAGLERAEIMADKLIKQVLKVGTV